MELLTYIRAVLVRTSAGNCRRAVAWALALLFVHAALTEREAGAQTPTDSQGLPSEQDPVASRGGFRDPAGSPSIRRALLPPEAHRVIPSLNVKDADLRDVFRAIGAEHNLNLAVDNGIDRRVTVRLSNVSAIDALLFLSDEYGIVIEQVGAVLRLRRPDEIAPLPREIPVVVRDGLITLELAGDDIHAAARAISEKTGANVVIQQGVGGYISGYIQDAPVETGLRSVFESNGFSLSKKDGIYFIGQPGIEVDAFRPRNSSTRLIRLKHVKAEGMVERLPEHLRQKAAFQVIKEQNGIVAVGSDDVIAEAQDFFDQIDIPTPQILIEALVVDFEETDLVQVGATFGRRGAPPAGGYNFGAGDEQRGGYFWEGDGDRTRSMLGFWGDLFGFGSIGRLPSDFYLRLQALVHEGRAEVRSRPQIATLSGHTASISVGTTQYYILKSIVGYPIPGQPGSGEVEHFERVDANVTLEITPWVSASGEVTAEIRPEFATPVGMLDPRVPPTINNRVVNTTVRLRHGETVVIGGLIQETQSVSYNKVPVLGSIPLLGHLFRNRRHDTRKSELVIFITPHVFYGDEADAEKWERFNDQKK